MFRLRPRRAVQGRMRLARWSAWLVLGLLWFRLIDHLRIEWSLNPQYQYGFAVPFLCIYLFWRNAGQRRGEATKPQGQGTTGLSATSWWSWIVVSVPLLYLPTRLIQEANPEWRLVSWALVLEVIALTLFVARADAPKHLRTDAPFFPLLFFLVAVPWPTIIEAPLIQVLSRAGASTTSELLNWLGVPALQHGNLIEVGSGTVGVDDACSGIRSLQATLMLSLLLGDIYRLTAWRRAVLCVAGFVFAFVFNVGRTTLLSAIAAKKGIAAIGAWHDSAGILILLACFMCLWALARALGRRAEAGGQRTENRERRAEDGGRCEGGAVGRWAAVALFVWFGAAEVGTELWYRAHEWHLPVQLTWTVDLPATKPGFHELALSREAKLLLRYDEAKSATWLDGDQRRWQLTFLRWNSGRVGPRLASMHSPGTCIAVTGRKLVSESELRTMSVPAERRPGTASNDTGLAGAPLELPYRLYTFGGPDGPLHVFYCLWEDRAVSQAFTASSFSYGNRIAPVLAGSRNHGQRTLELAVWGISDEALAQAEFERVAGETVRR